ncbi:inositol monophosphatase [uncultured Reyranella sp.]|uniref:inositol monophosphatase family protein n=1 Tax=uncultured Reyranella sp. TaxID=735512 RepID=UPI0025FF168A|nr:inositol monophosphatase [uncultured Reyranella sp.]
MLGSGDSARVVELMRETAAAELLPRFRNLAKDEVRQKRPGDIVTVADVASEQRLASGLAKILPGVPVVGEEAVEKDPGLLDLVARPGEACWIVDPLDGTANFAAGRDRFAMIICLVQDAAAVAGWILDVPNDRLAVAERGAGVRFDGDLVRGKPAAALLNGFVGYKIAKSFDEQLSPEQRGRLGTITTLRCAGAEYLEILAGRANFSLYRTTKPWDHAAGTLMMREAGGGAVQFGAAPYMPAQPLNAGLITASTEEALSEAKALLETSRMPLLTPKP